MLIRLSQNWPNDPFQKVILSNKEITSSNKEKLEVILLDRKVKFDAHFTYFFKM